MSRKPTILPSITDKLNETTAITAIGTDDAGEQPTGLMTSIAVDDEDEIVDAPFGAKVGSGRTRPIGTPPEARAQTYVSAVNAGAHLNIYLEYEFDTRAKEYERGISVSWRRKSGKPVVLVIREATQTGYGRRTPPAQHPHFTVPTARVGGATGSILPVAVRAWLEGDAICVDVSSFFADDE